MIGESADYDGWRIESMELACHYDELEGAALDVYRLGWRLHTTTPDKVILAGPEDPYPTLPEGRELLTLGRWFALSGALTALCGVLCLALPAVRGCDGEKSQAVCTGG